MEKCRHTVRVWNSMDETHIYHCANRSQASRLAARIADELRDGGDIIEVRRDDGSADGLGELLGGYRCRYGRRPILRPPRKLWD